MTLDQHEREKYERIWSFSKYRKMSPGENTLSEMLKKVNPEPNSSFIDFGCGTGRAAQKLQDKGFDVTGIDFASNCLDPHVHITFVVQNLWEPIEAKADYGYCTDVMEHIPTERVDDVLKYISDAAPCVFFQIAMFNDSMGRLIGEPLHLTVENTDWWNEKLGKHFTKVNPCGDRRNYRAVCYK